MKDGQDVQDNVKAVSHPEKVVGLLPDHGVSEDEDDDHNDKEEHARQTSQRLEEPVGDGGLEVAGQTQLFGEATQVFHRLRRDVVKIDNVADRVQQGEKKGCQGAYLVKLDVGIEWDILLDGELLQFGQQVARHGQQQEAVAEREGGSGASRDGNTNSHYVAQIGVLGHERVVDEAVNEERNRHHVEDEQVENVLTVLLEEGGQFVPFAQQSVSVALLDRIDVEAGHTGHVSRRVQEVLLGTFAVEPDGYEVAAILAHHQLEVVVGQGVFMFQSSRLEHAIHQLRHLVVVQTVVRARDFYQ